MKRSGFLFLLMIHQIPVSSLSLYFLIRIHAGPNTVVKDAHSFFSLLSLLRSLILQQHIVHTTPLAIHSLSQRALFDLSICRRILVVTRFRNIDVSIVANKRRHYSFHLSATATVTLYFEPQFLSLTLYALSPQHTRRCSVNSIIRRVCSLLVAYPLIEETCGGVTAPAQSPANEDWEGPGKNTSLHTDIYTEPYVCCTIPLLIVNAEH
jgi:hypothetical protein